MDNFEEKIKEASSSIVNLLIEKNKSYGNSYFRPVSIFSKFSVTDRIDSRIDEKLARIRSSGSEGEDTYDDLIGLLLIRKIATDER
jgi:hypothetical protein